MTFRGQVAKGASKGAPTIFRPSLVEMREPHLNLQASPGQFLIEDGRSLIKRSHKKSPSKNPVVVEEATDRHYGGRESHNHDAEKLVRVL